MALFSCAGLAGFIMCKYQNLTSAQLELDLK